MLGLPAMGFGGFTKPGVGRLLGWAIGDGAGLIGAGNVFGVTVLGVTVLGRIVFGVTVFGGTVFGRTVLGVTALGAAGGRTGRIDVEGVEIFGRGCGTTLGRVLRGAEGGREGGAENECEGVKLGLGGVGRASDFEVGLGCCAGRAGAARGGEG